MNIKLFNINFVLFLLLGLSTKLLAQKAPQEIADRWDSVLDEATRTDKIILIDFYTSWCGPCKMMDAKVFPDPKVSNIIDKHFILLKLDAETDPLGSVLAARYMVRSYPTFLILDSDLRVLRMDAGYKNVDLFSDWLREAANNRQHSLSGFSQKKYLDYPDFYLSSFGKKENRTKPDSMLVKSYLSKQEYLTSETSWAIMRAFEMPNEYLAYFKQNYDVYKEKYGTVTESKMAYALFPELETAIKAKSIPLFINVLNQIPKYFDDPGRQQSTYLFNIPREPDFYEMKVNFLDTCQYINDEIRYSAAAGLLMNDNLQQLTTDKVISWILDYPRVEDSSDPYTLFNLALAYHYRNNHEKALFFFNKAEKMSSEDDTKLVDFYRKKLKLGNRYTIKAVFDDRTASGMAYLSFYYAGELLKDSVKVENGVFEFSGDIDGPQQAYLQFKPVNNTGIGYNGRSLYLDRGTVIIEIADILRTAKISGVAINKEAEIYKDAIDEFDSALDIAQKEYRNLSVEQRKDKSIAQPLSVKIEKALLERDRALINFVEQNPDSYFSLHALGVIAGSRFDGDKVAHLYERLSPALKKSKDGLAFAASIAAAKGTNIGQMAPDFTHLDVDNTAVKLSDFKGKYVLLDFWASWCGPCRAENPIVLKAYNKFKDQNFTVLGVSIDSQNDKAKWLKAIKDDGMPWVQLIDSNKNDLKAASNLYVVKAIPTNFLIDPNGKIIAKNLRGDALEAELIKVLNN